MAKTIGEPTKQVHVMVVVATALLLQIFAGILYWWPALSSGLRLTMNISQKQVTVLLAIADSNVTFGVLGGFYQSRFGSRIAGITGGIGLPSCFIILSLCTFNSVQVVFGPLFFYFLILVHISMAAFSFMIYSSCITASSAVLPSKYRGRVVGLAASIYGAGPGIFSAFQGAFYPHPEQLRSLLLFCAVICLFPIALIVWIFPEEEKFSLYDDEISEETGLCPTKDFKNCNHEDVPLFETAETTDSHMTSRINTAFYLSCSLVVILQSAAIFQLLSFPLILQPVCIFMAILCLIGFAILPVRSSLIVHASEPSSTSEVMDAPPLSAIIADPRYQFLCCLFAMFVGGGTVGLLVLLPRISLSAAYVSAAEEIDIERVSRNVRTMVILFSVYGVMARLLVAKTADYGANNVERQLWKYKILRVNTLLMCFGLLVVSFGRSWSLYLAVTIIGFCYGIFFAIAPALLSLWFGVKTFARNFAILSTSAGLGTLVLGTFFSSWLMETFGSWDSVSTSSTIDEKIRVCTSNLRCYAPVFLTLAVLQLLLFCFGTYLVPYVRNKAEKSDVY